jgi:hypothetical protein
MQGTAADIIKRAMIAVDDWLLSEKPRVRMIMQVPCIGALIAARSAPARRAPLLDLISGRYRRRPSSVST